MVAIKYLEEVILPIIKKSQSKETLDDFEKALRAYKSGDEDAFDDEYGEYPDEVIEDIFSVLIRSIIIIVEKDTKLDIGEDNTELATLEEVIGDKLYFHLTDIYADEAYKEGLLSIDTNGNIEISADWDNGEIADAISNNTGYGVDSVIYSVKVE
jgi:hypothetical protein